ncbi:hypothetical protein F4808DRAFT_461814 [Astrocystis sublimbata]|nr:hypothetical protein F4808DRAFT_461814 [Astrocystis sublimbata]
MAPSLSSSSSYLITKEQVNSWLDNLGPTVAPRADERAAKRRKVNHPPASPPASGPAIATHPKPEASPTHDRETPPPPPRSAYTTDKSSAASPPPSSYASSSQGSTGPQFPPGLDLALYSIRSRMIQGRDGKDMPASLSDTVKSLARIRRHHNVVRQRLRAAILASDTADMSEEFYFHDYVYSPDASLLPHITIAQMQHIADEAAECRRVNFAESEWKQLVHTPLLDAAIRDPGARSDHFLGFHPSTSAHIIKEYFPHRASGKMVFRRYLPKHMLNHTDFKAVEDRPIAFSIETTDRDPGYGVVGPELRMGLWHAAQWRFLRCIAGDGVRKLDFLPGVVVSGHQWSFVATTYIDGEVVSPVPVPFPFAQQHILHAQHTSCYTMPPFLTQTPCAKTLWAEQPFGSTDSVVGTFAVAAGLALLRRWATEVFWPWYKTHVFSSAFAQRALARDAAAKKALAEEEEAWES